MNYKIATIAGDGIGTEIMEQALLVLKAVEKKFGHTFETTPVLMGGAAYDVTGHPLPEQTVHVCKASDAVLMGAVGGEKWDNLPSHLRPEAGLLGLIKSLELYCNLRPVRLYPELSAKCPIKDEIIERGVDIVIVRELTGGAYFGKKARMGDQAFDTIEYSVAEIERICEVAFQIAEGRRGKLTSVDKANVMETSKLWRETVNKLAEKHPNVELSHMYVDNAAMQLIINPGAFDVIVTENMFGDILSDEASVLMGSLGMLPSASLGQGTFGLYEPAGGSAPDIAGKNLANPIAMISCVAMMLRHSLALEIEATAIETAILTVIKSGTATRDICTGDNFVGTREMTSAILSALS